MKTNKCTEWCNHCETEVEISTEMAIQKCPNCGKFILPCNMCDWDTCECSKCELAKACEALNETPDENEIDYYKEFKSGNTTITRCDYEDMPSPMNTSSLSDDEMQRLAEAIETEMSRWQEWLEQGDINQDQYEEAWWQSMEELGIAFGMTYYEDEE